MPCIEISWVCKEITENDRKKMLLFLSLSAKRIYGLFKHAHASVRKYSVFNEVQPKRPVGWIDRNKCKKEKSGTVTLLLIYSCSCGR